MHVMTNDKSSIRDYVESHPLVVPAGIAMAVLAVALALSFVHGYFELGIGKDIVVGLYSTVVDLVLTGTLLWGIQAYLSDRKEKRNLQLELELEIDIQRQAADKSGDKLAQRAIERCIRALSMRKQTVMNLSWCDMSGSVILSEINNEGYRRPPVSLRGSNLFFSKWNGSIMLNADLSETNCAWATFRNAAMTGVHLDGANLSFCDFTGAQGVDAEMVLRARSLYEAKIDINIRRSVRSRAPWLLLEESAKA